MKRFAMTTISYLSPLKASLYVAAILAVCAIILSAVFIRPVADFLERWRGGDEEVHQYLLVLGVMLTPYLIYMQLGILWCLIFGRRRAVWIVDSKLCFLDYNRNAFPCSISFGDISQLSLKERQSFSPEGVIVNLKNGGQRRTPTLLLSEPKEAVLSRLNSVLRG